MKLIYQITAILVIIFGLVYLYAALTSKPPEGLMLVLSIGGLWYTVGGVYSWFITKGFNQWNGLSPINKGFVSFTLGTGILLGLSQFWIFFLFGFFCISAIAGVLWFLSFIFKVFTR